MRSLFAHIGVSLDGFISDGAGQPVLPVDEEFQRYIDELLSSIDGMVLGRVVAWRLLAERGQRGVPCPGPSHA